MKRVFTFIAVMVAPWVALCAGKQLLIGLSEACPEGMRSATVEVNASYADAVVRAGHLPVVISRFGSDAQLDALVAKLDVLVMTCGEDIAPARYNATESPKLGSVNTLHDDFDFRILASALSPNRPRERSRLLNATPIRL